MTVRQASSSPTRREFVKTGGAAAAGVVTLASAARTAHAAEDNTIRLALIGCGNRGNGAVRDALSVANAGPIKLYAAADLLEQKIARSLGVLTPMFGSKIDVPKDRQFVGFDAYKQAIDLLRPGDIAMCTTRAYVRPVHVEYAVKKGVNVFMEKPFASDPGGLKRMLAAGRAAEKKGVKIAAGLQCRHSPARQALIERIRAGELGDIHLIRANRLGGANTLRPQGDKATDLMSQLQFGRIHLFWVGSGHMVDYLIHQIDECCWLKDSWPVAAHGFGGRTPRSKDCGQNVDVYSMEFTFADGCKAFCGFRRASRGHNEFATFVHGTKCAAQFSGQTHAATVHQFKDQRIDRDNIVWTPTKDAHSPWQYEWNEFIKSIRKDRPHNEAVRAVYSDLATQMGRAASHLNRTVTWEEMLGSDFQFCDYIDKLDYNSPAPIKPDSEGRFAVPQPGAWKEF